MSREGTQNDAPQKHYINLCADITVRLDTIASDEARLALEKRLKSKQKNESKESDMNEINESESDSGESDIENESDDDGIYMEDVLINAPEHDKLDLLSSFVDDEVGEEVVKESRVVIGQRFLKFLHPSLLDGMARPEDLDVDKMKEKPWRENPKLIPLYFNYGFNEDTWRAYLKRVNCFANKSFDFTQDLRPQDMFSFVTTEQMLKRAEKEKKEKDIKLKSKKRKQNNV